MRLRLPLLLLPFLLPVLPAIAQTRASAVFDLLNGGANTGSCGSGCPKFRESHRHRLRFHGNSDPPAQFTWTLVSDKKCLQRGF